MVGKRRSAANKKASPAPITDSLVCIYCRERVSFGGTLPATEYEAHLGKTCNVLLCIKPFVNICHFFSLQATNTKFVMTWKTLWTGR